MALPRLHFWTIGCFALLCILSPCRAEPSIGDGDEALLHNAGLSSDAPALLAFFHSRARTQIDAERFNHLLQQLLDGGAAERDRAASELVGLGALALPAMRPLAAPSFGQQPGGIGKRDQLFQFGVDRHK